MIEPEDVWYVVCTDPKPLHDRPVDFDTAVAIRDAERLRNPKSRYSLAHKTLLEVIENEQS